MDNADILTQSAMCSFYAKKKIIFITSFLIPYTVSEMEQKQPDPGPVEQVV